jgi:predicted RNA binding protein YcfA (HicA-like mRNA interferase family)
MAQGRRKEVRDVERVLVALGYRLARSKNHLVFKHDCGAVVSVSASASDPRAYLNLLSDARRALRERGHKDGSEVSSL